MLNGIHAQHNTTHTHAATEFTDAISTNIYNTHMYTASMRQTHLRSVWCYLPMPRRIVAHSEIHPRRKHTTTSGGQCAASTEIIVR